MQADYPSCASVNTQSSSPSLSAKLTSGTPPIEAIDEVSSPQDPPLQAISGSQKKTLTRKRKREEDELEEIYMRRVLLAEAREEERKKLTRVGKQSKQNNGSDATRPPDQDVDYLDNQSSSGNLSGDEYIHPLGGLEDAVPLHESLQTSTNSAELEKSSRTVFLGNVSILAITSRSARKALLAHLSSFLPSLSSAVSDKHGHKLESIRFRSTAFSSNSIPKKAAYVRKELMDATTKSTNAYAVYSTALAAREASTRLNGTVVLDRHLRLDSVAHPAKVDHRRCVFVGNLGFVDDVGVLEDGEQQDHRARKKNRPPGDVEEGLWQQFGRAGAIESVRVVRDPKTRVGKGFAYVQFVVWVGVGLLVEIRPLRCHRIRMPSKRPFSTTTRNFRPCCHANFGSFEPRASARRPQP